MASVLGEWQRVAGIIIGAQMEKSDEPKKEIRQWTHRQATKELFRKQTIHQSLVSTEEVMVGTFPSRSEKRLYNAHPLRMVAFTSKSASSLSICSPRCAHRIGCNPMHHEMQGRRQHSCGIWCLATVCSPSSASKMGLTMGAFGALMSPVTHCGHFLK